MADKLTAHEALIFVMVTTSVADRAMEELEVGQATRIIGDLPVFRAFAGDIEAISERCLRLLGEPDGVDSILEMVAEALPPRLYETAYALSVEVAASDLRVGQEELVFLQMLEDRLELSKLAVAAIEHSARVRFRTM